MEGGRKEGQTWELDRGAVDAERERDDEEKRDGQLRDEREEPEACELRHLFLQVAYVAKKEAEGLDHKPH